MNPSRVDPNRPWICADCGEPWLGNPPPDCPQLAWHEECQRIAAAGGEAHSPGWATARAAEVVGKVAFGLAVIIFVVVLYLSWHYRYQ